jgi:hypothetical protein
VCVQTGILVLPAPDNSTTLTCPPTGLLNTPLTCTLIARRSGLISPVLARAFAPAITTGRNGVLTALTPTRFAAEQTPLGDTASHYTFTLTASDSARYTLTDGLSNVVDVYTVAAPDVNSTLQCTTSAGAAATQVTGGSVVQCTVRTVSGGAPAYYYTSGVQPAVSFTATGASAPSFPTGVCGAVSSTLSGDALSASASGSAALRAVQFAAVGTAFTFTYTAPQRSGSAQISVRLFSPADSNVLLLTLSTTLAVVAVPDSTSRIVCPAPRLTVGVATTCFTLARAAHTIIQADTSAFTYTSDVGGAGPVPASTSTTAAPAGGGVWNVRLDSAPTFDVSMSDVMDWGLSLADTQALNTFAVFTAPPLSSASVGGGLFGSPVPPTPLYAGAVLTSASAKNGTGLFGPSGVQRAVYFDVTCGSAYETMIVRDGVSPPVALECAVCSFSPPLCVSIHLAK